MPTTWSAATAKPARSATWKANARRAMLSDTDGLEAARQAVAEIDAARQPSSGNGSVVSPAKPRRRL